MLKQFANSITATDLIYLAGLIPFGIWLLRTSFGKTALSNSPPRRNNMPVYLPFIALFFWFGFVSAAISIVEKLLPDLPDWQSAFVNNLILCIGAATAITAIIFSARAGFARRLKGFGLSPKAIHKDFFAAVVNLLSVWPLVMLMIVLTLLFGQLIWGKDFQIQQHEELKTIAAYTQLPIRVLIIITTVFVVPVFEEMLFRGLFQTMLRSLLVKPWRSIAVSSAIFATFHANVAHWPALFVLSVCMGYSYEKSGSLFRPIFIHSLFNAISIVATLYQ